MGVMAFGTVRRVIIFWLKNSLFWRKGVDPLPLWKIPSFFVTPSLNVVSTQGTTIDDTTMWLMPLLGLLTLYWYLYWQIFIQTLIILYAISFWYSNLTCIQSSFTH